MTDLLDIVFDVSPPPGGGDAFNLKLFVVSTSTWFTHSRGNMIYTLRDNYSTLTTRARAGSSGVTETRLKHYIHKTLAIPTSAGV